MKGMGWWWLWCAAGLGCDTSAMAAHDTDTGTSDTADTGASDTADTGASDTDAAAPAESQLPPEGHAALTVWLAKGHYLTWHCEGAPHASRPPGAHGRTRICSNDAIAKTTGSGAFPIGAAAVKELRRGADDAVAGYAVYRKVADGGAAGWYWYEVDRGAVYADGRGDKGDAKDLCVSCHEDAPHDFVFTEVR